MLIDILLFLVGVGCLVGGAWLLVTGGSRVAAILGVPPVVIGLTVVAFGTSAPELFVSLVGAVQGKTGLVLGNVIGSNVANIGLILATAALLRPVVVERGLARREMPLLLGSTLLFALFGLDGTISRFDGLMLVIAFAAFMGLTLRDRERETPMVSVPGDAPAPAAGRRLRAALGGSGLVVVGVVALAGGGQLIINAAETLARAIGISETLIGLSLVAIGTSLPELATTLMAAWRNQDDLALGNIVGSNLFNLLAVAGPVALIKPLPAEEGGIALQLGSMVLLTVLVYAMIARCGGSIGRLRGAVLLVVYAACMATWIVSAS